MERLTIMGVNGVYGLAKVRDNEQDIESRYPRTLNAIFESWQMLAQYENTALNPAEIATMQAELAAYRQAKRDGTLVRVVRCRFCMYAKKAKSHPQINCMNQNSSCYRRRVRGSWYCMAGESALAEKEHDHGI